jgi:hypothetical protein
MAVKGDNGAALYFLSRWAPGGPWALTAIRPDRKAIDTRTFWPSSKEALRKWLEEHNGHRNIYFHVNPPIRDISKKAEREDIKEVAWLHVDIDPRAGEDLSEERKRALELLTTKLPRGVPAPTVVIFSGGGYQGFWRLKEPIPINGDLERAEDAKRYNQQLEVLFGADNCHNIDRIMRLPGTVNIPDEKKKKKGRKPELAVEVSFSEEGEGYDLSLFTAAPAVQMPGGGFDGGEQQRVKVSGNIERITDVNELDQWGVPDRVKVIIVQGRHPDEPPKKDNSRSSWVFDCVCQLVRAEVPDDVIFSILTDPDFGISESVIEKGSNASKYAIRQIERAKEEAIDPWLRELNEKFAVIGNIGGKCRVVEEVMDHTLKRSRLTRQSFDDFRNRYMNKYIKVGEDKAGLPIMKPVGAWWLANPNRRQFDHIIFAPGLDIKGAYNMWKGFSVAARPGDCSLLLGHIRNNICQGNEEWYNYLIQWLARLVQHPDSPGEVAVVLRGGKGTGKSFFAKQVGSLLGRHFLHISNPSHLIGNFNSHLRDTVLLFADEAFYAGDKKHESILKTLITEETIQIEAKGVDVESSANFVHIIMASNNDYVVPASGDERRYFVLDVGAGSQQSWEYFNTIDKQMKSGGLEALLHMLLTMDIKGFNVRAVPQTEALRDQKDLSLDPTQDWWLDKLVEGSLMAEMDSWPAEVRKEELVKDYVEHAKRWMITRRGSATSLGKFLNRVCPGLQAIQKLARFDELQADGWTRKVERRAYHWILPSLEDCRARWEQLHGARVWPSPAQGEITDRKGRPTPF